MGGVQNTICQLEKENSFENGRANENQIQPGLSDTMLFVEKRHLHKVRQKTTTKYVEYCLYYSRHVCLSLQIFLSGFKLDGVGPVDNRPSPD